MSAILGVADHYEYPYNLVCDILGQQHMPEWLSREPTDSHIVIETLLDELGERPARIMRMRYDKKMSYAEIALVEHRTLERMRQVVNKSLRILNKPTKRNRILYGEALAVEKADEQRKRSRVIFYAKCIADQLQKKSQWEAALARRAEMERIHSLSGDEYTSAIARYIIAHGGMQYCYLAFPDELGLILTKAGIQYVWQLALYSELDLRALIHLNDTAVNAIKVKLREYGWGMQVKPFSQNLALYSALKREFVRVGLFGDDEEEES